MPATHCRSDPFGIVAGALPAGSPRGEGVFVGTMSLTQTHPDFRVLFESAPGLYLVLSPDLRIVAVSDAYLAATKTTRREVLGRGIFEVFPDNPDMPDADGVSNLFESLQRATQTGQRHVMVRQRYDVRDARGGFVERHWLPTNTPVFDGRGSLLYVLHHAVQVPPV